jgi:hypothetical protein
VQNPEKNEITEKKLKNPKSIICQNDGASDKSYISAPRITWCLLIDRAPGRRLCRRRSRPVTGGVIVVVVLTTKTRVCVIHIKVVVSIDIIIEMIHGLVMTIVQLLLVMVVIVRRESRIAIVLPT